MTLLQIDSAARARVQAACHMVNEEIARQRSRARTAWAVIGVAALPALVLWPQGWRVTIAGSFVLGGWVYQRARKEVATLYKRVVMQRVVKALGSDLAYRPESSLTRGHWERMDLFPVRPSSFRSEDEVRGRKANVTYAIHEVRATRREGKTEKVLFRGFVAQLEFNKHFQGHTVVVPDREGRSLPGKLFGDALERSKIGGKQIVRLENPDFEAQFSVYGTDDQEARYLLTPKMMELIMEANALQPEQIRLAFLGNFLYVTVPSHMELADPGLDSTVSPESALGELATVMQLAERLVSTLDLETRIWSRA
ncbi:MAG TPA: DUF3137 domain-containing protein [Gemmatimonadaceae bacterium]